MKDAAKIAAELAGDPSVEARVLREIIAEIMLRAERWRMWIVNHRGDHRDHACAECFPNGDSLIKGFRCVPHEAQKP